MKLLQINVAQMPVSSFSPEQILPFWIAFILLFSSILMWNWKKTISLTLLVTGAFATAYFAANLDPFFSIWDEQFHALVAKNMANDPFTPVLYKDHPLPYDHFNWVGNSIWLHKQPLFLWQMALSIKLLGPTVLAVRLPSIILFSLLPLLIYQIGKITMNKNTGFYAALIFATSYFPLMLVAGSINTDHNDFVFLFYVTASFWAWFEYQESKKFYWLIAIGVFSGFAVLTKWLMGLLVYVIWFLIKVLFDNETRFKVKSYLPMVFSGIIAFLVFLPWQFYIFKRFPVEAKYEYELNSRHFYEAVENHKGSIWYHFQNGIDHIYGTNLGLSSTNFLGIYLFILFGLFAMIFKIEKRKYIFMIFTSLFFVYLFYSIAATKMPAFTVIMMPFLILAIGATLDSIFEILAENWKKIVLIPLQTLFLLSIMQSSLNLNQIENRHAAHPRTKNIAREANLQNQKFIKQLSNMPNLPENMVLFNAKIAYWGHIPIQFFTGIPAFEFFPADYTIAHLKKHNKTIAVVDWGDIPSYIKEDSSILIIKPKL